MKIIGKVVLKSIDNKNFIIEPASILERFFFLSIEDDGTFKEGDRVEITIKHKPAKCGADIHIPGDL